MGANQSRFWQGFFLGIFCRPLIDQCYGSNGWRARGLPNTGLDLQQSFRENASDSVVLFVDSGVLSVDKNAGDVSLSQFMSLFASHGWRVYFWSCSPDSNELSPSDPKLPNIYRLSAVSTGECFESWWAKHADRFNVVILSRPAVAAAVLPVVRRHGHAMVAFYGHDLHFARLREEAAVRRHWWLHWIANRYRQLELSVWRSADISYYPSQQEVQAIQDIDPSVAVRYLAPYHFDLTTAEPNAPPARQEVLFVGNFAHPPNVDAVEWLVAEIWPLIRQALPAAELLIVGSGVSSNLQQRCLSQERVRLLGWISDDELKALYEQVRVVVVPLRFGAGVKHKVVTALAQARPVVTTAVGMQGLQELMEGVVVADSAKDIAASCVDLLGDQGLWMRLAKSGRAAVAERFTRSAMWQSFGDLRLAKSRRAMATGTSPDL
jgi:glycosyltransferase involved in cell wall biosynthesis